MSRICLRPHWHYQNRRRRLWGLDDFYPDPWVVWHWHQRRVSRPRLHVRNRARRRQQQYGEIYTRFDRAYRRWEAENR